jgi:predicted transcriptional regulator
MKLIMNCVEDRSKSCRICDLIATKLRRRQKEVERIKRWKSEINRKASIEASEDIIDDLDRITHTLERERLKRRSYL